MAQLPPDGSVLIQQIGDRVVVFDQYTEREHASFDPADANDTARAQKRIHDCEDLTDEQKCFAHFWSGYFYAHASRAAA